MNNNNPDYKDRIKKRIESFEAKQIAIDDSPRRTNEKPEKEVEKSVVIWLKQNGFCCDVVEAKATFSTQTMRYTGRHASAGTSDIVGNYKNGLAVFIELKAAGKRSTLRENQLRFLTKKIHTNCFAVVVDSVNLLETLWSEFKTIKDNQARIEFLLNNLPKKRETTQESLFD